MIYIFIILFLLSPIITAVCVTSGSDDKEDKDLVKGAITYVVTIIVVYWVLSRII